MAMSSSGLPRTSTIRARAAVSAVERSTAIRRIVTALVGCLIAAGVMTALPARAHAATSTESAAAASVFNMLNGERAANHLPALVWSTRLVASSRYHDVNMAARNTLSHQVYGEAPVGNRISAMGVPWHAYAENIAYTTNRSAVGAEQMQQVMYGERAPNDGHRLNILSRSVRAVGVDVLIDARTGKLWLTEDFADTAGAPQVSAAVIAIHSPIASLGTARALAGHRAFMGGWAVDPDNRLAPVRIAIRSDSRNIGAFNSTVARPDVAAKLHAGPREGFGIAVTLPAGRHNVCAYAINIGLGANRLIACRVLSV